LIDAALGGKEAEGNIGIGRLVLPAQGLLPVRQLAGQIVGEKTQNDGTAAECAWDVEGNVDARAKRERTQIGCVRSADVFLMVSADALRSLSE
jgi:hypothetical protein